SGPSGGTDARGHLRGSRADAAGRRPAMTSRFHRSTAPPLAARRCPRRRTALGWSVLLLAGTLLGGCSLKLAGRHAADPTREAPKPSGFEQRRLEIEEQAALAPAQPYWPYRMAEIYLDADSTARAEAALKASLARDPVYAPALSLLSKLYFDSGRHAEAVEMLEAARSAPGAFPPALAAGLALHYDALNHTNKAQAVISALPRSELETTGSAMVYVTLRGMRPDSAATLADAALKEGPKSAANHNNLGIARLRAGDPEAARREFLKAIDLDSKRAGPYYNLAILEKYYLFDDAKAARWFGAYWDRSRADPDSLYGVFHTAGERKKLAGKEE